MQKKQADLSAEPEVQKNETQTPEETPETQAPADAPQNDGLEVLQKELEETKSRLAGQNDLLLRTAAEFDNFKKRTQRERDASIAFIRAQTVKGLLPCYDSLDRALCADCAAPEYAKGLELALKQFLDAFTKLGLEEIKAEGEPFDPGLHEAIMHVEDENAGESVVLEVLQKGYKMGGTVLRPAMVKVAN
mgnify:CR=1 FL=1